MWFIEAIIDWARETVNIMLTEFFDAIGGYFSGREVIQVLNMDPIKQASRTTTMVATVLLGILGAKHYITTYVLETDGDKEMDPLQYLVKVSVATAIIQSAPFLIVYLISLAQLAYDKLIGNDNYVIVTQEDLLNPDTLYALGVDAAIAIPYLLVMGIGMIILIVRATIRTAELVAMKILLPIFCCNIISPSRELWNTFIFSFLVNIFGYIIQLFSLNISIRMVIRPQSEMAPAIALGFLFFSLKAPKWLERFVYNIGMGGAGHSAMFMAPQLLRLLPKK